MTSNDASLPAALAWTQMAAGNTASAPSGMRAENSSMKAAPVYPTRSAISTVTIAALAGFIAVAVLSSVAYLFLRDGRPLGRLAAAERACAQHDYWTERETCMNGWLAEDQGTSVARR